MMYDDKRDIVIVIAEAFFDSRVSKKTLVKKPKFSPKSKGKEEDKQ